MVCKVKATPRYTYLVHIGSSFMNFGLYFAFANHSLVLVWTNYGYVQAFMVDVVIVQLGQSVDVLITTNHTSGKFYMAGTPFFVAPYSTVSFNWMQCNAIELNLDSTLSTFCYKPWVCCVGPRGLELLGQIRGCQFAPINSGLSTWAKTKIVAHMIWMTPCYSLLTCQTQVLT
jgi:hypothetical protein